MGARKLAWVRHANEVARTLKGCGDHQRVLNALRAAQDKAKSEGVIYSAKDEDFEQWAAQIAFGTTVRWS